MWLLIVYVALVIVADVIAYFIGLAFEQAWPLLGLPFFLALFFFIIVAAWPVAVRLTEPKKIPRTVARSEAGK
jgi:hypothetical protein